jgi:hypothetical protein
VIFAAFISGLILIVCGFLVKSYPDLIAGYNTLSEEEKQQVDIVGLSSLMQKGLIIIGCTIIIYQVIGYFFDIKESYSLMIISGIAVLGIVLMIIKAQKYYPKN